MNADWLFKNLSQMVSQEKNDFFETIVYLDPEQLSETYSGLTGLRERPKVEVQNVGGAYRSSFLSSSGVGALFSQTFEVSDSHLLQAMLPGLKMIYPRVTEPQTLRSASRQRIWMAGDLRNTLYVLPRGLRCEGKSTGFVLEFAQCDIKCSLMVLGQYMSSIYRSFINEQRTFEEKAELFGYLHSFEEKKVAVSSVKEKIVYEAVVAPIVILKR
jgi:hypothetical protein